MKRAFWDDDIANLEITDLEKNGLQVFRNYNQSAEEGKEKKFKIKTDNIKYNFTDLESVLWVICNDDKRIIAIVCASFCDDLLEQMLKKHIPKDVPGGSAGFLGSLSTFSKRIQIAYAFDMCSRDLLKDVDCLRTIRNDLAHKWDVHIVEDYLAKSRIREMTPIENFIDDKFHFPHEFSKQIDIFKKFRIRLIWMACLLKYEAELYFEAKKHKLDQKSALFGRNHPNVFPEIVGMAINYSHFVIVGDFIFSNLDTR